MPKRKLETLTEQMYFVLLVLKKELCGGEITKSVSRLTNNRIQLGPGTLYAILSQFEEEGIIYQTKAEGRKRSYLITSNGEKLLESEIQRLHKMILETNTYLNEM